MTDYRPLGRTGVLVSPLTLGAMNFGSQFGTGRDEAARIVGVALDAGINVIDTADVYSQGESEEIVGHAIKGRRDEVVLASKFHGRLGEGVTRGGNSRRWAARAVEESLRRLGTDHLDLYQVHRPDPHTELEETLGALSDLVRAGKIRYYGTSTFEPHEVVEAQYLARAGGLVAPSTEQAPYSILARGVERALLPVAERFRLGILTWSPLAGGWLSGRWRRGARVATSSRAAIMGSRHDQDIPANLAKRAAAEQVLDLAEAAGLSLVDLALAWVLRHPAVSSVIVGPRTVEQLTSQLAAPDLTLDDALLDAVDEIVSPGTTLNPADSGYVPPSLTDPARRRRPVPAP
ncbi:aldo/keto reductase [Pseudonocardia sp. WMMC193]|uniref:aldo/keto reductase n=1 Tax=Pseudonocardia sp. WMMC193 TaxID=2911965 RepID=UPI001F26C407|nr:aldo/keto reductase [Pseudonocardia sp. WMMC193]MCF7553695.1 aldo/keto reductase [Pseudonocardia sp. WMMC193]